MRWLSEYKKHCQDRNCPVASLLKANPYLHLGVLLNRPSTTLATSDGVRRPGNKATYLLLPTVLVLGTRYRLSLDGQNSKRCGPIHSSSNQWTRSQKESNHDMLTCLVAKTTATLLDVFMAIPLMVCSS